MHRFLILTVLCLSSALTTLSAADGTTGVLHINRVFSESEALKSAHVTVIEPTQKARGTIDSMTDEIEATKAELDLMPEGSPARYAIGDKLEVLRLRRKLYVERQRSLLGQIEVDLLKTSYTQIRKHLADFAAERGLTTVLLGTQDSLGATSMQELQLELATNAVLYHASYLDITDDFLAYLDQHLELTAVGKEASSAAETVVEEGGVIDDSTNADDEDKDSE